MGSRAVGAFLAFAAAAAFAVAIGTSAWWSGGFTKDGHTFAAKTVHIGLYAADGCNSGGDGSCESLPRDGTFAIAGYVELVLGAIAIFFALALGIATLRVREVRVALAKLTIGAVALAAVGAIAAIIIGPLDTSKVKGVELPIGWGLMVFTGGVACALAACILAPRAKLEPLRLKSAAPQPPSAPAFDVRELLREEHDTLRPASLGPEPMIGRALPPSPGGHLAGPSGPLGAPASSPLFQQAPTLRPLYEMSGTAAPMPPPPPLPTRGPTPVPRESVESFTGRSLPPPKLAPKAAPKAAPNDALDTLRATPPPPRPIVTPPKPNRPMPTPAPRSSAPTLAHAAVPPPIGDARPTTDTDDRLDKGMRDTEAHTSVEVDAEAKARLKNDGDEHTDTGVAAIAPRGGVTDTDEMETVGRERVSASVLAVGDHTDIASSGRAESSTDLADPASIRAETTTDAIAPGPDEPAVPPDAPRVPNVPLSTAPPSLPPPSDAQVASTGPSPACPQCEAPMAWVEEHLRFYCKSCRMYF